MSFTDSINGTDNHTQNTEYKQNIQYFQTTYQFKTQYTVVDFDKKNEELKKIALECGAYADDKKGNRYYLGVWENETSEALYDEFITLGSKKYVYKQGEKVKSTISGVSKKAGAEFFKKHGLEALKKGTIITNSGHLTAFYNDVGIHKITVDHCTFTTGSNVALVNNEYKIGVTKDYLDLLQKGIENVVDLG